MHTTASSPYISILWKKIGKSLNVTSIFIAACAVFFAAGTLYILLQRAFFPLDTFLWSESAFLTNILRIVSGGGIFSSPGDLSSFVYPPGMELFHLAVLGPLDALLGTQFATDIRPNRLLNLFYIILAAVFFCRAFWPTVNERVHVSLEITAYIIVAFAMLRVYTIGHLHPDNGMCLAVAIISYFALRLDLNRQFFFAVLLVVIAPWVFFIKQTGVLLGPVLVIYFALTSNAALKLKAILGLACLASIIAITGLLLSYPNMVFYNISILSQHPTPFNRFSEPIGAVFFNRIQPLLWLATIPACHHLWNKCDFGKRYVLLWLLLFPALALTGLAPYYKALGGDNNLMWLQTWPIMVVLPYLLAIALNAQSKPASHYALGFLLLTVIAVMPNKLPMSENAYKYAEFFSNRVGQDLKQGKNILIGVGAMPFVLNHHIQTIRDRANTVLEVQTAFARTTPGKPNPYMADFVERISSKSYDVIYLNSAWYTPMFLDMINENYQKIETIGAANTITGFDPVGVQPLMGDISIMIPR